MSDFVVRALVESELREAQNMLRAALHFPPVSAEEWALFEGTFEPNSYLGVLSGGQVVGTTYSFPSALLVPGGKVLPMSGVARVGVRPDRTRRGFMTELMRYQLKDARARGDVLASLYASQTSLYGRFGYGVCMFLRELKLRGARVRADLPRAGQVRIVTADEATALLPGLYERIGLHRIGMMTRGRDWWPVAMRELRGPTPATTVVHSGPDGDDGFLIYRTESDPTSDPWFGVILNVLDLQAPTPGVRADLWRFLLGIDLVGEVRVESHPVDRELELILEEPRKCQTVRLDDDLWLRLIDVPAALEARTYGEAEPVAITVNDPFLPDNSGTYLVGRDGAGRADIAPGLVMDVSELAMVYLGSTKPSELAAAGRIQVLDPAAVARADRLFATDEIAWCGTGF